MCVAPLAYIRLVNPRRLQKKLERGDHANVRFGDLTRLLEALGFRLNRVRGSHHVYTHPDIPEILNLQNVRGQAKPYQVRQVARTMTEHQMCIEDRT